MDFKLRTGGSKSAGIIRIKRSAQFDSDIVADELERRYWHLEQIEL